MGINRVLMSLNLEGTPAGDGNEEVIVMKVMEGQGRRRRYRPKRLRSRRCVLMKRRARLDGSRGLRNGVEKRVRTLKKLIPNGGGAGSNGLEGLFREAADYILSLQMRVKVMQVLVRALSSADDDH